MTPAPGEALDAYAIAVDARARIEAHERICSERYLQIAEYQRQSNEARAAMQAKLDASFKALYALIWKAAFGVIAALGAVVLFLVERVIE
jgi:hypothetical protein